MAHSEEGIHRGLPAKGDGVRRTRLPSVHIEGPVALGRRAPPTVAGEEGARVHHFAGTAGACGNDTTAPSDATPTSSSESAAVDPELLPIHPVVHAAPPPCGDVTAEANEVVVADPSDDAPTSCLVLGPAAIDATAIEEAEIVATGSADSST